jgi:hypothetical protein
MVDRATVVDDSGIAEDNRVMTDVDVIVVDHSYNLAHDYSYLKIEVDCLRHDLPCWERSPWT